MDDEYTMTTFLPSEPMHFVDFVFVGLGLVGAVAEAVADAIEDAQQIVAMHANYRTDQARFKREAGIAIEQISEGRLE